MGDLNAGLLAGGGQGPSMAGTAMPRAVLSVPGGEFHLGRSLTCSKQ